MKIVGLVAEYNPFHNGHKYHIEKAKEITGADHVIVVMSGDYVQRGTPAIMPKHLRAEAALKSGASLVIELPVCYATASAEYFAYGAISILEKLGCVDSVCFGSECGNVEELAKVAEVIANEPVEYRIFLQSYLKEGNSYPLARQKALNDYLHDSELVSIMVEPNNILGIEYLKALYKLNSKIKPYTIIRQTSNYHDTNLQEQFSSASAIRKEIELHGIDALKIQVPESCYELLEEKLNRRYPLESNDFSLLLKHRLLKETKTSLCEYADVSEELANRILNQLNQYRNFDQFCELLKTKEMTYSRISRALFHILLEIRTTDLTDIQYARVLGFQKKATAVLSAIKDSSVIPLIGKLVGYDKEMLLKDIFASNLYESVVTDKFQSKFKNEYEKSIVIV